MPGAGSASKMQGEKLSINYGNKNIPSTTFLSLCCREFRI